MPKSPRPSPRLAPLIALPLLILAACANQTPTAVIDARSNEATAAQAPPTAACVAFARLTFDRLKDTPETIVQIKAYDAARDALCGKGQ